MADSKGNGRLPLSGLNVIDLTRLLPGPLCTMMLGDYGAEIVKVEDVDAGDPTRFVGRLFEGSGSFFRQLNRNKKSLALNLKTAEGREIIRKLAVKADVLVEGFRPGVMDRLGLGYEEISKVSNRLVYAAISGYGQEGPYRERAGHDINYTAIAGLLDLSAANTGSPIMPAVQIADIAGGSLMALSGIMFALFERQQSGKGSFVDISMNRGLLPWLTYAASTIGSDEKIPRRGSGHITGAYACYNIYETADGKQMTLGALEPVFWQRFCETVGKTQWVSRQFEQAGQAELIKGVELIFKEKSRQQWEELFATVDACCEPVLNMEEAINHPVSQYGNYWLNAPCGEEKTEIMTGFPLLFTGSPGELRLAPPRHGEHTMEILQSIGYDHETITGLIGRGIIKICSI